MKSKVPKTKTVSFKRTKDPDSNSFKDPDWTNPMFNKIDITGHLSSFITPCFGDSGSGQIFSVNSTKINIKGNIKFVLAAVYVVAYGDRHYTDSHGNEHRIPCGSFIYDKDEKNYLESGYVSQSITYPEIFKWIKFWLKSA